MAVFSATKTFNTESALFSSGPMSSMSHAVLVYVFLLTSAVILIVAAFNHRKISPLFDEKALVVAAGAFGASGTILLLLGLGSYIAGVAIAAICMGASAALFILMIGNEFARFEFATSVLNSVVSVALGFICAVAFTNWVPSPISGIVALFMPLLMMAIFWKEPPSASDPSDSGVAFSYISAYLRRFAGSMLLFGFVLGALRVVCADKLLSSGAITIELVIGVACIAAVVLFLFAIVISKRETFWDSLYRTLLPVVMLGLAFLVALSGSSRLAASFFVALGYASLVTLLWTFLSSLARNLNGSSLVVFGLGYGAIQAASALGCLLANGLLGIDASALMSILLVNDGAELLVLQANPLVAPLSLAILAVILFVVMAFAYSLLPRYRELKAILSSVLSDMMLMREEDEGEQAAVADAVSDVAVGAVSAASDAGVDASADAPAEDLAPEGNEADDSEAEQPQREDKGSFVRRCEQLSDTYGLSAREREVFFLLAKGHNAAFITDKLCVSRSTTKTHINHIYKKMDIHTQQELLTMVEDRARGPLGADIDRDAIREALENDPSQVVEHIHRDYIGF